MAWDGIERRKAAPATRRFVVIVAILLAVYVSVIFWRVQENGAMDNARQRDARVTQYRNDVAACKRGDDIRSALNSAGLAQLTLGACALSVEKP